MRSTLYQRVYSDEFGASGPYDLVVSKGTVATDYAYYFGALGDEIIFGFSDGPYREFTSSNLNLATGTWHHIAATFSDVDDSVKLYHNGVEVLSASTTYSPSANSHDLYIGSSEDGADWDGVLDEVRIYERALGVGEILEIYTASAPPAPGYIEMNQEWSASASDTWETVDLSVYGVPPNAVVEVAVNNFRSNREYWGGVRAVGSSLQRRVRLHEAEGGGVDVVTMHVQVSADGEIQHYSDDTANVEFTLLGFWTGASYVERFDPFVASSSNAWVEENVGNDGLGPNQVAEIVMLNSNQSAERSAGLRASGSTFERRFTLHEAEAGGVDAYSMMVGTDASSIIEVFAQSNSDIEFVVLGYWETPPGTYVENGVGNWTASTNAWETVNLAAAGVPANAVLQVVFGSLNPNGERIMGVRRTGSALNRGLELHEAEAGGSERASMHVNVDAGANIQSFAEDDGAFYRFAPVGWWLLSP